MTAARYPRPRRHAASPDFVPQSAKEGVILFQKVANEYLPAAKGIHFVKGEYRSQNDSREYKAQREVYGF